MIDVAGTTKDVTLLRLAASAVMARAADTFIFVEYDGSCCVMAKYVGNRPGSRQ